MSIQFGLRFDFRNPDFAETTTADRYAAALDMAQWAEELGGASIGVSEHHAAPDGYLPSPLPMLAAMAARTSTIRFRVAALIAPYYDPLRLAEDMVVLDHLSKGRIDLIVAAGYAEHEFAMYGVPMRDRVKRVTELVATLKAAFRGEPFEFRGRTVQVTPAPYRPGGPRIDLGGSSEPAARRAARIADGFLPSVAEVWDFYRDEVCKLGRPDPGSCPIGNDRRTIVLAEDTEKGWELFAPYFLHETNAYGALVQDRVNARYQTMDGVEQLRASGAYAVLTPDELIADLRARAATHVNLHPMCGGIPIDLAWSSLRLFEREVLPAFS